MDLINLPMDLLRSFLTITEFGGFTKAGEALGRTQPAMSLQMQRLEALVGAKLFRKKGRQLVLTEQGERLASYSRQILRLNDAAISELSAVAVKSAVNLGFASNFHIALKNSCIVDLAQNLPVAGVSVHGDFSAKLLGRMMDGELDVVIAAADSSFEEHAVAAWPMQLSWLAAPHWRADGGDAIPVVCGPEGCELRAMIIELFNIARIPWRIVVSSPDCNTIAHAVASGVGVTLLPQHSALKGSIALPADMGLPAPSAMTLGLYHNPRNVSDAARHLVERLAQELENAFGARDPVS